MATTSHPSSPVIAYCITHQAAPRVSREDYLRTVREFHGLLGESGASVASEHSAALHDAVQREVQAILGALSPFLQTPMRNDAREVRRILEESMEKFASRFVGERPAGLTYSIEGRVFLPVSKKSAERRLLQQGREYLTGLGFETTRNHPSLHESVFVVDGGAGLDILEHLVRDRIGIYAPTHGRHTLQFHRSTYAAYNMLHTLGVLPVPDQMPGCIEAGLFFVKPRVQYGEFRDALFSSAGDLMNAAGPAHLSVWQRKLGLGSGVEYVLRLVGRSAAEISGSVHWLSTAALHPMLKRALVADGRLVLKEILFPL